jgi:O-antigen ligase
LIVTVFLYATIKRPELALLGILIATSSIVFEEQLPLVSVGGASLHIPDLLLLSQLALIVFRCLMDPKFKIVRTPLDLPLLIFLGITLLSTFVMNNQSSADITAARREVRVMFYYLTFFVVTNRVRERRQLRLLLNGLFLLATIVAAAMSGQFILGSSISLLPGRVEKLVTQNSIFNDITRIIPPGWSIILVSFVSILCILVIEKAKPLSWLKIIQFVLLGIAIIFTFLRSYWAAIIIVLFLLSYIIKGHERRKLIKGSLIAIFSAAILLVIILSDPGSRVARLANASMERLSTLGRSGTFQGQDGSLNWRKIENQYAFATIASHPLLGLGLAARYRPRDPRIDGQDPIQTEYFRRFIHNGHFRILLQSGLLGYLSLMWLSFAFLVRGFKFWRRVTSDWMKGVVLGFTLVYLAVLIAAVVNSTFNQWYWVPVLGIIMGTNEAILMIYMGKESVV